jgi:predicted metal-dependent hydrolase
VWYPNTEIRYIQLPGLESIRYQTEVRDVESPRIEYDPAGFFIVIRNSSSQSVTDILWEKRDWLESHLQRVEDQLDTIGEHPADYQGELYLKGSGYRIERAVGDHDFSILEQKVYLEAPDAGEHISHLVSKIKEYVQTKLKGTARKFTDELDVKHPEIHVRNQKTKWGSCSSTGITSFNVRSGGLPRPHFDYLVAHELAHQTLPNHGSSFWGTLESVVDAPKKKQEEIAGYWHLINQNEIWQAISLSW